MCGIAGFYGFRDDELIKKISTELEHRGPDGEGFLIDDKVTLLNRRLAIIDRKGGDQPIYNEDRSIVIVFVGEIYNYREQMEELKKKGHKFRTKSDTEVIVHAYEEWGEQSFDRHNGMFTFALYDKKKEKLLLVRDHFGIKPLYYSVLENKSTDSVARNTSLLRGSAEGTAIRFSESHLTRDTYQLIFSSEIKPLINSGLIEKKPNDRIIYRYLKYRIHDDQRETFFEGVNRLMPGEYITIQNSEFRIQNYTNLKEVLLSQKTINNLGNNEINKFKDKLIEAIKLRLISEVPVGSCLSGGLDSSTVVTVVNKLLQEKVKEAKSVGNIQNTFSAVFPDGTNNEEKYINLVVESLKSKVKSHNIYPKPEEFFAELEDFVKTQEEPTISTGPYAQYKVMQEAHKYVTVLLDGQGADEMLAGYDPYNFFYLIQLWNEGKYAKFFREFVFSRQQILAAILHQVPEAFGLKRPIDMDNVLGADFKEKYREEKFLVEVFNLKKRLADDIFANSLQALLRYEDRNAMRFSIEGRVPFLDINLLKYLFSLPDEAIIKNGWNKNVLRKAVKGLVPERIRLRKNKIGFTTPEYQWFLRMKNRIYQIFLSESFAGRKYFNQTEVLKAFQEFIEGKNDDTMVFWRMLNLEIWMRIFIDSESQKSIKSVKSLKSESLTNEGKKLEIEVNNKVYLRYPIRSDLIKKDDNVPRIIASLLHSFMATDKQNNVTMKQWGNRPWFIVVSEKIVAISQGRSYFIWEIKAGFWANLLSKFVKKTPYGIGLGSPWTMQLAINEAGLLRILLATVASAIGKSLGVKGLFYRIAGNDVNAIDGPTEYSVYPSNVSAKLGPKEPEKVSREIAKEVAVTLNSNKTKENFLGTVIIDANDLGQNVLGNSTGLDNKLIEKIFKDNPMGQSDEQTPLVIVSEK